MNPQFTLQSIVTACFLTLLVFYYEQSLGQIRTNWFDINPSQSNTDGDNPNGASGGRIQHLGAASNLNRVYAASEWGGLWTSFNQGLTWIKVNSFIPSATWDVKVDPRNSERIYVTSFFDGRALRPRSGISISNNAGNTWTNAPLPTGVTCQVAARQNQPSAWQIAINPGSPNKVFVGTNCGLARSFDSGATWDYVDPSPADNAEQIYAVIAHGNSFVDVIGDNGHFRSNNDGAPGSWTTVTTGAGFPGGIGSVAVSPAENYVLFATNAGTSNIFESDNGGQSWPTSLTTPGTRQGRIPFVKTNQRITSNQFDLWYGDTQLFKTTATTPSTTTPGGTPRAPINSWTNVQNGAHWDVGDLLFDPRFSADASPLLFANDGGVYRNLRTTSPASQLPQWEQPNISPHATWLWGFDGAQTLPGVHGIYYGLQDNGSWGTASAVEGPASPVPGWNNNDCCDAFDDAAQSNQILYTQGIATTGRAIRLYKGGAGMSGVSEIPNYPSAGTIGGFKDGREVVRFGNNAYAVALSDGVYITNNINDNPINWTSLNAPSIPGGSNIGGLKVASTPSQLTSIYYHTGSGNPNGIGQVFRRAVTGTGGWQQLPLPTGVVGGAAVNITGVTVYDVDPNNGNNLIIAGIDGTNNFSMWRTSDFGANWTQLNILNNLMTGGGTFLNRTTQGPTNFTGFGTYWQPFMVEFNPNNGNTVVAGAADAGVFLTTDFGNNWNLISNPNNPSSAAPHIPRPLFAHFSPTRFTANSSAFDIWIGTQGAGVMKVLVESP